MVPDDLPVTVSFTRRADPAHAREMTAWIRAGLSMAERGGGDPHPHADHGLPAAALDHGAAELVAAGAQLPRPLTAPVLSCRA